VGYFVEQLTIGLSTGAIYAIIAIGFNLVFGVMNVLNLAYGATMMVGTYGLLLAWFLGVRDFWLAAIAGVAFGLLISSLVSSSERAIQLVPLALLPMIFFGGAVTRLVDIENEVARQIATVMPARWAFEAALVIENKDRPMAVDFRDVRHPDRPAAKVADDFTLVHYFFEESPHPPDRLWTCLGFLAIFPVVFSILATLSLRLKDVH